MATRIIFRKDKKDGEITAVFLGIYWDVYRTELTCYAHIGQHGPCAKEWVKECTVPAKPEEYKDLLHELTHVVGYNDLRVKPHL